MTRLSYTKLADQLTKRATRAVLGLRGLRNQALRTFLEAALDHAPGAEGSFLADPVFEAIFGWRQADQSLGDLSGNLLHPSLVRALSNAHRQGLAEDYRFPVDRKPYAHQLMAWRTLKEKNPVRSVLVTSGTGSGKTECFLVPILNDLSQELDHRQGHQLTGVRALFLYPLNALIKSQQDRLVAWSEPFNGQVRFCLYNGDTPNDAPCQWQCQVPDRRTLRTQPPPILVTNATMLEYLLVRGEDRPILNQSQGCLRWIVIDEAHSYIGSQAAELTLLLRRVIHAFGVRSEDVRFIGTSATLGDSSERSRQHLAEFMAAVAGVPTERVSVIEGFRQVPSLAKPGKTRPQPLSALSNLSPPALFDALQVSPSACAVRSAVVERPQRLSDLTRLIRGFGEVSSPQETLQLLDLCSAAVDEHKVPFLPLRGHFFHRTLSGVWACANSDCGGRVGGCLDTEHWPFGAVFLERHLKCNHCGFPVYEVVQCGECGAEYLSAFEHYHHEKEWLKPEDFKRDEDEFQQELESVVADGNEAEAENPPAPANAHARLLSAPFDDAKAVHLSQEGALQWIGTEGSLIHLRMPEHEGCGVCHELDRKDIPLFRPLRVGAPFLLNTAISTLFEHLPDFQDVKINRPRNGRRLISFTDSRQGTARFAVKLQQGAERDYIRSLLYHSLMAARVIPDPKKVEELRMTVAALEQAAKTSPALAAVFRQEKERLDQFKNPFLNRLGWVAAEEKLLQTDDFHRFLLPTLREISYHQLTDPSIARLCLLREFFTRPRRQFSLEGLGLVQLRYSAIEQAEPPAVMRARGVTPENWRALLRITLDFFIRSGSPAVAASPDTIRWLGYPGRASWQLAPLQPKDNPAQRSWPSSNWPLRKRNRLIRLLAHAFRLDPDDPEACFQLDELLRAIWDGVRPVLNQGEDGYRLALEQQAEFVEVRDAWLCPMTHRLLPIVFQGLTPYLPAYPGPDELTLAKPIHMPSLPHPFWLGQTPEDADHWLETDPAVLTLRDLGAWTDISDRIARHSPFFLAKEHSAQLSGRELTRRENAFKEGRVNLLSCSTTMEMGVDIGGLTAVTMNNVPPHPANYLQRAGRAGRRGETRALSFTMCKANPQGEAVFRDPTWPFTTSLALPRVELRSEPIVQRHVNSLALARFLSQRIDQVHRLHVGWFFEALEGESSPAGHFTDWCEIEATADEWVLVGVEAITRQTLLAGVPTKRLLMRTAEALRRAGEQWRNDLDALLVQREAVKTQNGNSGAERAIDYQLRRLRQEYLLGELADLAFLPGYGFPTDVVPFVTTTLEELNQQQNNETSVREDNRTWRAGYPSRNLAIAIRDYAPGTDTVLDGRVYRSSGVTLNWQMPVDAQAPPEIQALRWVWRCKDCGDTGTRTTMPESCPGCEASAQRLVRAQYLQPSGFAVDLRDRPHNDVSIPQYIPVRDPFISLEGAAWMNLPVSRLGRYRSSPEGHLFQRSDGLYGQGYALCLRCGRADPQKDPDELPSSFQDHKRLRGGRLNDREVVCPGNTEPWAIRTGLILGVTTRTDLLELQLREALTGQPIGHAAAYTLGVALRRSLCQNLGIEEAEVGTTALRGKDHAYSIYLYDTASGGAGYASQAPLLLPELLRNARTILECPRGCDNACQACVLTLDSQYQLDHLDRNAALDVLSSQFLDALALPEHLRAFGDNTHLEMEPLTLALSREWQRLPASELRVHLGGDPDLWEPLAWAFRHDLVRFSAAGVTVRLLIPRTILAALGDSQRSELAVLAGFSKAEVYETPRPEMAGGLPLCIELSAADQATRWAASDKMAVAPTPSWGSGSQGASYVRTMGVGLDVIPSSYRLLTIEDLQPASTGLVEVRITNELDGRSGLFGEAAWRLVRDKFLPLAQWLDGSVPLSAVCYTDRYLRSPLALHLIRSLLVGLTKFPGGIGTATAIKVQTARLDRLSTMDPHFVHHDWREAEDRRLIAKTLMFSQPGRFTWADDAEARNLPHARELDLQWNNGQRALLRLDQGVGYWRVVGGRTTFPFTADPIRQSVDFHKLQLYVSAVSNEYPTHWYVS